MSFDETITKLEDAAEQAKQTYSLDVQTIRSDRDLSADAKARRLDEAWDRCTNKLETLRAGVDAAIAKEEAEQIQSLFAPAVAPNADSAVRAATFASYRSAVALVESDPSPDRLISLSKRARMLGDGQLQKAVALVAFERGLSGVLADWSAQNPDAAAGLAKLGGLQTAQGPTARFSRSMIFGAPDRVR